MTTTTLDSATPASTPISGPAVVLRLEALALLAVGVVGFRLTGGTWGWFFALFLVPDLSFAGYLFGRHVGAVSYNAAHSLIGPALLGGAAWSTQDAVLAHLAFLWLAHLGLDRALGYGLKYASGFFDTHLGRV